FILDSAASFGLGVTHSIPPALQEPKQTKTVLVFSAGHPESLKQIVKNHQDYILVHPNRLQHVAYTLAERREHLKHRAFCVTDGKAPLTEPVATTCQSQSQVAFVFTGQGAQWVHMGKQLMADYPPFMSNIRSMDRILQSLEHAPSWSIEGKSYHITLFAYVLSDCDDKSILAKAEYAQPICTALQLSLVDLLETWEITPSAVVGHSSGEIAAAYAAGSLTKADALTTAFYRGYICKKPQKMGGMAAVSLGKAEVTPFILPGVTIACENSSSSVTLSGDIESLEKVMADIKEKNEHAFVRRLHVEMAYHSDHMRLVGDAYHNLIAKHLDPRPPKVPFFSSVHGGKVLSRAFQFGPRYWQENLERPVLFRSAVNSMLRDSPQVVLLEVGPHSTLRGPLRQICQEASHSVQYISTLSRGKNDTDSFLSAVGQLYTLGVTIKIPLEPINAAVLTDLPTYPWQYQRSYWSETRVMKNWRFRKHLPHDLLGVRTLEGTDLVPTWRNEVRIVDVPWLRDHCVGNDIIFPAAGYIAMAGEAVYQLGDDTTRDYTVKNVDLRQALVLHEEQATEMVTTLRPQRLTTSLDSDWYEFQIVSYDGAGWNKHCSGLVRKGRASARPASATRIPETLPRKVSSPRWYATMARVGLNYGPRFVGLENITAGVTEKKAAADIIDRPGNEFESLYALHPATLDLVLQTWTVAAFQGEYRAFNQLFLPTFIEELFVGDGRGKEIRISTATTGRNVAQGQSYGVGNDGNLVFLLKGFRGTALESDESPPDLTALSLQWKPDFSLLDASKLTRPTYDVREQLALAERLYLLCAVEANKTIQGVTATQPHFERYRRWLTTQCPRFEQPGYPLVEDSVDLVNMSTEARRNLITEVLDKCRAAGCGAIAAAVWRSYDQLANVFEGKTDFLDLLIHDGTLSSIYDWMNDIWDVSDFFQLLGHTQPQMKILEIGAGTGGLTAKILKHLQSEFGERLYLQYTFTDVSSGFFVAAKERFKQYDAIEYKTLDISRNPLEQGFNAEEYDLVIASNVLHATPILHDTLSHVRTLLTPQGRLFLQELSPMIVTNCMVFIMGLFSGWWLGEADGRIEGPFLPPEEWDTRLRAAGFSGCETVTFDNERPYHINANIVARPAMHFEYQKQVSLLSGQSQIHPLALQLEILLCDKGYSPQHYQWGSEEQPPADQDLISFVDLDGPLLKDPTDKDWDLLLQTIQSLQEASVLWLTPPAQINAKDPHAALILGVARTIRSELDMPLATLELENIGTPEAADAALNVFRRVQRCKDEMAELDPDMEFAWVNGAVHIGRFHWYPIPSALKATAAPPDTKALTISKRGLLQTLHWSGRSLPELPADQVQVEMKAVGLNFTDVLIAMGVINSVDALGDGYNTFGLEGAGYVSKVGTDVDHVKPGDKVMLIGTNSTGIATQVQRPGGFVLPIPDHLSFEDAATMPAVYVTVLLGLFDKAHLAKGQSILIHAAAGGIGIAAINVARWIGADIYCTVGSEEKAEFLVKEFGIPRNRIFHSRDTSFRDDLMAATDGVGVDCVLNSVSGELLHTSWECVASSGCMVEIGKRDMIGRGQLALGKFEDNRTFIGADLSRYTVFNKPAVARLMRMMLDLYIDGHIAPVQPITLFDAESVESAFRYMQQGIHIGKVVIRFPDAESSLPWAPTISKPSFRGDRCYLLVGGMGGLGQAIATWMATHGAKHLIFLSRSAGKTDDDQAFIHELNLMGCAVQAWAGDVADPLVVHNAIEQAPMPIAGVMQMAMVLRDIGVMDMDLETYQATIRPKVDGTWNLHNAVPNDELDFFVLFSSVCGMVGYYGQANYAAANTFLDAFVQYRHERGLRASVMDIGAVNDVGYISRTPAAKDAMLASAGRLITEQDFLDTLQLTIARSSQAPISSPAASPQSGTTGLQFQNPSQVTQALECRLPIMHPQNNIIWKRDPRMSIYRNIETVAGDNEATTSGIKPFLSTVNADPSQLDQPAAAEFLAGEVRDRVATFLMRREDEEPLDLGLTLSAAGVDSLVAIEVRNWWKQNLGVEVSVLELMNGGSMLRLGELAAKRLREKLGNR
ncbi:putative polyketide synthase, partial [Aspergillus fischeri NRRL 181]